MTSRDVLALLERRDIAIGVVDGKLKLFDPTTCEVCNAWRGSSPSAPTDGGPDR
jgi:hypothetical protein